MWAQDTSCEEAGGARGMVTKDGGENVHQSQHKVPECSLPMQHQDEMGALECDQECQGLSNPELINA